MIEEYLDQIIENLEHLIKRLKRIRQSDDMPQEKVEEFIHEIDWAIPNLKRDLLVRRLVRELKRDKSLDTRKFDG